MARFETGMRVRVCVCMYVCMHVCMVYVYPHPMLLANGVDVWQDSK